MGWCPGCASGISGCREAQIHTQQEAWCQRVRPLPCEIAGPESPLIMSFGPDSFHDQVLVGRLWNRLTLFSWWNFTQSLMHWHYGFTFFTVSKLQQQEQNWVDGGDFAQEKTWFSNLSKILDPCPGDAEPLMNGTCTWFPGSRFIRGNLINNTPLVIHCPFQRRTLGTCCLKVTGHYPSQDNNHHKIQEQQSRFAA